MKKTLYRLLIVSVLFATPCFSDSNHVLPSIAIIIDDLGDQRAPGERTVQLPGPVSVAILPHTPHSVGLAHAAHAEHKEIMLHLPLESDRKLRAGPGVMQLDMDEQLFRLTLLMNLNALPHLSGVNNHMGSKLTRFPRQMNWLMENLEARNLFFIDSMTTASSVAYQVAAEQGIPTTRRHVFLDDDRDRAEIRRQFERLIRLAKLRGFAVAIGHPYDETLSMLEEVLPELHDYGVRLVPISNIINLDAAQRTHLSAGEQIAAY